MDGDALSREAMRLAEELARSGLRELGKRWRCPAKLRLRIVAYALQCRERGEAVADIAGRLGLADVGPVAPPGAGGGEGGGVSPGLYRAGGTRSW